MESARGRALSADPSVSAEEDLRERNGPEAEWKENIRQKKKIKTACLWILFSWSLFPRKQTYLGEKSVVEEEDQGTRKGKELGLKVGRRIRARCSQSGLVPHSSHIRGLGLIVVGDLSEMEPSRRALVIVCAFARARGDTEGFLTSLQWPFSSFSPLAHTCHDGTCC